MVSFPQNSEGNKQFGRHRNRPEDNIEIDLEKKFEGRYVLDLCGSGEGQMLDSFEHSNESPNSKKCAS
jgi:hypothetical protein